MGGLRDYQETQPAALNLTAPDHWFVAQGVTDLNNDGVPITFELTSHTRSPWIGTNGVDSLKGWD